MALLVWFTVGVSIWHFTVFMPDRCWGGIIGALLGSSAGAMVIGAAGHLATGDGLGETDLTTVLFAIPGAFAGIAVIYAIGVRRGPDLEPVPPPSAQ